MIPGPGDYDPNNSNSQCYIVKTIYDNPKPKIKLSQKPSGNASPTRLDQRSSHKNIYFPEYKKEFFNLEGPGPGRYHFEKFINSIKP